MAGSGFGFGGHDPNNDDVLGKPRNTDPYNSEETPGANPWGRATYGGQAAYVDPQGKYHASSAETAAADHRVTANQQTQRPGVSLNFDPANRSINLAGSELSRANTDINRGVASVGMANADRAQGQMSRQYQMDATNLHRDAALGSAPSRAEILGNKMTQDSLHAQLAGAASARGGPLAQMAAQRNVQNQAANFQQQGAANVAALRADEMARARGAYSDAAGAMRSHDYGAADQATRMGATYGSLGAQRTGIGAQYGGLASTQADMGKSQGMADIDQRHLNQNNEQFYGGMAHDVRQGEAQRGLVANQLADRRFESNRDKHQREVDRETGLVSSIVGGIGGFFGSLSDMRAKVPASLESGMATGQNIGRGLKPLLLDTPKPQKKQGGDWLDRVMTDQPGQPRAEANRPYRAEPMRGPGWHQDRYEVPGLTEEDAATLAPSPMGGRADPYTDGTDGLIQREDPYGSGGVFFSDEAAKEAAFADGMNYAQKTAETGEAPQLPSYLTKKGPKPSAPKPRQMQTFQRQDADKAGEAMWHQAGIEADQKALEDGWQGVKDAVKPWHTPGQRMQGALKGAVAGTAPATAYLHARAGKKAWDESQGPVKRGDDPSLTEGHDLFRSGYRGEQPDESGKPAKPYTDPTGLKPGPFSSLQQDANRRGAGFAYAYKPQFTPGEQKPGEVNYGPSANELEKNPITATAIRKDPATGLRAIDAHKLLKTNTASIASLQEQIDQMKGARYG